jgi:hypothetical protein
MRVLIHLDRRLLSLLWNGLVAYDYSMTRMRNLEYFKSMALDVDPNAMLAWVDGFPNYAQFGWGWAYGWASWFDPAADAPSRAVPALGRSSARPRAGYQISGPAAAANGWPAWR